MWCSGQLFGHHVTRWINSSKAALCARCRQIETTTMASAVHPERITEDGAFCDEIPMTSQLPAPYSVVACSMKLLCHPLRWAFRYFSIDLMILAGGLLNCISLNSFIQTTRKVERHSLLDNITTAICQHSAGYVTCFMDDLREREGACEGVVG